MRCIAFALLAAAACGSSSTPPAAAPQLPPVQEVQPAEPGGAAPPGGPSAPAAPQAAVARPGDARAELTAGMARYDQMLRTMDSHGLGQLFTADGEVAVNGQVVASTPAGIEAFLGSFVGKVRVDRTASSVEDVRVDGNTGTTSGHYAQDATILAEKHALHATGAFTTAWQRDASGAWRIRKIDTTPDAPPHP